MKWNKEKLIEELEKRIERTQYMSDYFQDDDILGDWYWDFCRGKKEGLKVALGLINCLPNED